MARVGRVVGEFCGDLDCGYSYVLDWCCAAMLNGYWCLSVPVVVAAMAAVTAMQERARGCMRLSEEMDMHMFILVFQRIALQIRRMLVLRSGIQAAC